MKDNYSVFDRPRLNLSSRDDLFFSTAGRSNLTLFFLFAPSPGLLPLSPAPPLCWLWPPSLRSLTSEGAL
ncbi:hypothetical protein PG993_011758 [Apiospora rasikravindrae]|uniref:Uncharacterized protein n=1 Tax=Apiospora rasikravindrae TaxID=990691 RepID=A0ABR1S1U7_9PEZI